MDSKNQRTKILVSEKATGSRAEFEAQGLPWKSMAKDLTVVKSKSMINQGWETIREDMVQWMVQSTDQIIIRLISREVECKALHSEATTQTTMEIQGTHPRVDIKDNLTLGTNNFRWAVWDLLIWDKVAVSSILNQAVCKRATTYKNRKARTKH